MDNNSSKSKDEIRLELPFKNLFLNAGFVSGDNSITKYISTILLTIFAYFSYQILMGIVLIYFAQKNGVNIYDTQTLARVLLNPEALGISKNFMLVLLLGMFVFTFWTFYVAVKRIHQKNFISVITAYPDVRWSRVFFAFGAWAVIFLLMFLIDYLIVSPDNYVLNFDASKFVVLFVISIIFLPLQTSFEEIFFRGYLMQGLALVFKNGYMPLLLTSLLFGLAHMNNPEAQKFGAFIMLPYYSLFGLFLGVLALWNNGLELSIGIHAANNILSSLLITSKNSVLQTDALFIIQKENPVNDFLLWIGGAVVTLIIFIAKYQFKNLNQHLK
ncbi:MAG: abortive infection protein [Bacteroidia bacterium]|nr:MAG: abortive infection protein [Bacteroidia bacterium]